MMAHTFPHYEFYINVRSYIFSSNFKDPNMLPKLQVDRGAVKFVMSGAQIMCPGLTSAGGKLDLSVKKGDVVAVTVEGKEHALGVGLAAMSGSDM
jgi:PUA domain protein